MEVRLKTGWDWGVGGRGEAVEGGRAVVKDEGEVEEDGEVELERSEDVVVPASPKDPRLT